MRWTVVGADAILSLRSCIVSGRFATTMILHYGQKVVGGVGADTSVSRALFDKYVTGAPNQPSMTSVKLFWQLLVQFKDASLAKSETTNALVRSVVDLPDMEKILFVAQL